MNLLIVTNITSTIVQLATIVGCVYWWKVFMAYWSERLSHLGLEPKKVMGVEVVNNDAA